MKMAGLLTMFIVLLVTPIAGAYSYRYADLTPDPRLEPRAHHVTNEEEEERELRRLLIERLRQENQSYSRNERIQPQESKDRFSKEAIVEKSKRCHGGGGLLLDLSDLLF